MLLPLRSLFLVINHKGGACGRCSGGGGGRGFLGLKFGDAVDHVAYGSDGAEGLVGDIDVEGFFNFEGDVDLIERVDVELFEGAGDGDGVGGDTLRFGDDV